jgi:MFS superfamily sulfate permease-like transporter
MLVVIVAAAVIVLVALSVVKTFIWLTMIALVVAVVFLAVGALRLGRRSGHRPRSRL